MTTPAPNTRSAKFYIITGNTPCWKCQQSTPVSAIVVDDYEEGDGEGEWYRVDDRALLNDITAIEPRNLAAIQGLAPWMRFGYSATADTVYLANHCTHCDALQGDYFLGKPGKVFFPTDKGELQSFKVVRIDQSLAIDASPSRSGWHDWLELA